MMLAFPRALWVLRTFHVDGCVEGYQGGSIEGCKSQDHDDDLADENAELASCDGGREVAECRERDLIVDGALENAGVVGPNRDPKSQASRVSQAGER